MFLVVTIFLFFFVVFAACVPLNKKNAKQEDEDVNVKIDINKNQIEGLQTNLLNAKPNENQTYLVGVGIQDMTGPVGLIMFGYVDLSQRSYGVQSRMYARAFIIADVETNSKVCIVATDIGQQTQLMKNAVVEQLAVLYPGEFTRDNVIISASHTHSSVSGIDNSFIYTTIVFGGNQENFDIVRDGIVTAIQKAYSKLQPGTVHINQGYLRDVTQNRARPSYLQNPKEEREFYGEQTDNTMTILRLQTAAGVDIGSINWFAIHATSMKRTNILMSSDNKGYASYLFEKAKSADGLFHPDADDAFVAAFVAANGGDASGNMGGPEFQLDGEMKGPAFHPVPNPDYHRTFTESTKFSGRSQFEKGLELHEQALTLPTSGPIKYIQANVDMARVNVSAEFGGGRSCVPAQGYAMAAGCTDGLSHVPGIYQGQLESVPQWDAITSIIHGEIPEDVRACHAPKPIFIATGIPRWGIPMTPEVLPLQIVQIGRLAIVAFPGEITTMAGRRLKNTVAEVLGTDVDYVVIHAYANAFNSYTTTREEYDLQYYEGGHNLLGGDSLKAYQQEYHRLATALKNNAAVEPGPPDGDFRYNPAPFNIPADTPLDGTVFGDLVRAPETAYPPGAVVRCDFSGAHPAQDIRINQPYQTVHRVVGNQSTLVSADYDWDTHFHWGRVGETQSLITLQWFIPDDAVSGNYAMTYNGNAKNEDGIVSPVTGSCSFAIDPNAPIVEEEEDANVLEFPQLDEGEFNAEKSGREIGQFWIERIVSMAEENDYYDRQIEGMPSIDDIINQLAAADEEL